MRRFLGYAAIVLAIAAFVPGGVAWADPGNGNGGNSADHADNGNHGNNGNGGQNGSGLDGVLPGGTEGKSNSNPDGAGVNKPYGADGQAAATQGTGAYHDGNNGSGNDLHHGGGCDDNN